MSATSNYMLRDAFTFEDMRRHAYRSLGAARRRHRRHLTFFLEPIPRALTMCPRGPRRHRRGRQLGLDWRKIMPTLKGFGTFAALPEEQLSEKVSRRLLCGDHGMIVFWSIGAGVHVQSHNHPTEQIVWVLKGEMEFRLGTERRVCGRGDVVVVPGFEEHEAWFRADTEVIDFFAPPRRDFLPGKKPQYILDGKETSPTLVSTVPESGPSPGGWKTIFYR